MRSSSDHRVARLLRAWDRSAALHVREPPADAQELSRAEGALGVPLPSDFHEVYRAGAGELLEGNLNLLPLNPGPGEDEDEDALTVATAARALRRWEWPIPDQVIVFAGNGAGDHFGLWLPRDDAAARPLVVQIGEVFEPACLAVVGDEVAGFSPAGPPTTCSPTARTRISPLPSQRSRSRTSSSRGSPLRTRTWARCCTGRIPACPTRTPTHTSAA